MEEERRGREDEQLSKKIVPALRSSNRNDVASTGLLESVLLGRSEHRPEEADVATVG